MNHNSHPEGNAFAKYIGRASNRGLEGHFLECEECFLIFSIILRVLGYKPTEEEKRILAVLTQEKLQSLRA
jgi:hypothetical protein